MNYKKTHPDFGKRPSFNNSIETRKSEAERIRERYPERIPVICEKASTSKLPEIDKTK